MKKSIKNEVEVEEYYYRCDYKRYPDMYSPIYDKTFDKMTEDEIKHQLDVWVESSKHIEIFEEVKL